MLKMGSRWGDSGSPEHLGRLPRDEGLSLYITFAAKINFSAIPSAPHLLF